MTVDAIGIGTLVMTRSTSQDVAPGGSSVMIGLRAIRPRPTGRVRVDCAQSRRTDSAGQVARFAGFCAMTGEAARGLRRRLHGVTSQEICRMNEVLLDLVCCSHFDLEPLSDVVTIVAAFRRVAVGALRDRFASSGTMRLVPPQPVSQIRSGKQLLEVLGAMTRHAHSLVPLRLMVVTFKATAHLRKGRAGFFRNEPRVTRDALSLDRVHLEVPSVVELNLRRHLGCGSGGGMQALCYLDVAWTMAVVARLPGEVPGSIVFA